MSVQDALRIAGVVSLVMAAVLLALAMQAFVVQDIPSVLDDLSGRKRQREMKGTGSAAMRARATLLQPADSRVTAKAQEGVEPTTDLMGIPERELVEGRGAPGVNVVADIVICSVKDPYLLAGALQ